MQDHNKQGERSHTTTQPIGEALGGLIVLCALAFCTVCWTKAYLLNRETEANNAESQRINDSVAATLERITALEQGTGGQTNDRDRQSDRRPLVRN
jgi:hypothetical protein